MTWLILKAFLGKAEAWIYDHWQLVLFSILVLAVIYYRNAYQHEVKALEDYKQAEIVASNKQIAEFAVKKIQAQTVMDTVASAEAFNMTRLNLDRTKSTNDIKTLYDTKTNSIKRNLANRTGGLQPTASNSSDTSKTTSDTQEPTGAGQECDSATARAETDYKTLEDACTITTSDFNVCRAVIDADTQMYGREN